MRTAFLLFILATGSALAAQHDEHEHCDHSETRARLLSLTFNLLTAAGTSTATNDELRGLQLGNHDPRRRGFTLQQAELSFAGALEPWFTGEAYLVATEDVIELEEAFLRTLFLPVELKAGYYLTEFGRFNTVHPHGWRWADQPVAVGRILGPEGMRGVGLRAGVPIAGGARALLSVQNADDASMVSFLGGGHAHEGEHESEGIAGWPMRDRDVRTPGDLLYAARLAHALDIAAWRFDYGFSGATGPNSSGPTGRTWLMGADAALEWRDMEKFVRIETEYLQRYWQADSARLANDPADPTDDELLRATVLHDWGAVLELTGSPGHALLFGLRGEFAAGYRSGEELREADPRRDDRWRLSPLVGWQPVEEVKLTLQYNLDFNEHLPDRTHHSLWLALRVMFGIHHAH